MSATRQMRRQAERRFAPRPESAAAAREFVEGAVMQTGVDPDDALLLTGELVNNVIVHAKSEFAVRVIVEDADAVRLAVVNHAPELLPIARQRSDGVGRGLALLDGIANAWGFERRADVRSVWFELSGDRA
jgi:hypothetical protein